MKIKVKCSAESITKYLSDKSCCIGLFVLCMVWHECRDRVAERHVNLYVRILHFNGLIIESIILVTEVCS